MIPFPEAPAVASAGQSIQVIGEVMNMGDGPANGPWYDTLSLCSDPEDYSEATYLGMTAVDGPINVGNNYRFTNNITIPPETPPGSYYLVLQVDSWNLLYESDKSDNTYVADLEVQSSGNLPDLVPITLNAPASAAPGQSIQVIWGVTNASTTPISGSWYDMLWLSTNAASFTGAAYLHMAIITDALDAGGYYERTQTVTVPSQTAVGQYYILAVIDFASEVGEKDKDNNLLAASLQVQTSGSLPDLVPLRLTAPAQAMPGQQIQVSCLVTNRGAGAAMNPWVDQIVLSSNEVWDASDFSLALRSQTQPVPAAGSYAFTNLVTLPAWPAGSYYLILKGDSGNAVTESTESNNTLAVPVLCHTINLAGAQMLANGTFQFRFEGLVGTNYSVMASTNLVQWGRAFDFTCTNRSMVITDANARLFQRHFYQVTPQN